MPIFEKKMRKIARDTNAYLNRFLIKKNFGDNKILLDWFYKKPELEEIISNVFQFKNPIKYWENFYTTLINQC